ncbi:MAG: hypothetical protein AAF862_16175, partial [Pseudomonadota bacterium]
GPQMDPEELNCDAFLTAPPPPTHPCAQRDRFQELYRILTTEKVPAIQSSAGVDFVQLALDEMLALEDAGISAFERSNFALAIEKVTAAIEQADRTQAQISDEFASAFNNALSAFRANDTNAAEQWIDRAVRLNGQSPDAQYLAQRIAVLPDVLAQLRLADDFAVQNRREEELAALQNVLLLDGDRPDIAARLESVSQKLAEQRYSSALRRATAAVDAGDMRGARRAVGQAQAIYPERQDASALLSQIAGIEKRQRINAQLRKAQQFEQQDNWPAALNAYQQALKDNSSYAQAIAGRDFAQKVVSAQSQLGKILSIQDRFSDVGIRQKAKSYVDSVRSYQQDSSRIGTQIDAIEKLLVTWEKDVIVTVISDGKSQVIVRRVGQVGAVSRAEIKLKPGTYDFECSRPGYRSKIVQHFVAPQQNSSVVTISCDIKI